MNWFKCSFIELHRLISPRNAMYNKDSEQLATIQWTVQFYYIIDLLFIRFSSDTHVFFIICRSFSLLITLDKLQKLNGHGSIRHEHWKLDQKYGDLRNLAKLCCASHPQTHTPTHTHTQSRFVESKTQQKFRYDQKEKQTKFKKR